MTWEQIQKLQADGFEIGNRARRNMGVAKQTPEQLTADVEFIEKQYVEYGIHTLLIRRDPMRKRLNRQRGLLSRSGPSKA